MDRDTVDRHELDWDRIAEADAFELPNGDMYLIQRKVMCPGCGHVYAMVLTSGQVIHYGKRHGGCNVEIKTEEDEEQADG